MLGRRFPDALPVEYGTARAVGTGVPELDRVLPGRGLPRGRLALWVPGGGAVAVLQSACASVVGRGERVAWVDGGGVLTGESLVGRLGEGRAVLVRPRVGRRGGRVGKGALECAEELLRSGGFALVVLSRAEAVDAEAIRLSRVVREGGGAFVLLSVGSSLSGLRLRSWVSPDGYRWRRDPFGEPAEVEGVTVKVEVSGLGLSRETEFLLPVVHHEVRLSLESGLVDRRGAGV